MKPILVQFNKYTPSIYIIENYYCILSSSKFANDAESLKISEEMNKSSDKLFSPLLKSVTNTDSVYI